MEKKVQCSTGEFDVGTAMLDVGTEEPETEFTTYNGSHWLSADNKRASSLRCDSLAAKRRRARYERLERMNAVNTRNCEQYVIYGTDLLGALDCLSVSSSSSSWAGVGYLHCLEAQLGDLLRPPSTSAYWRQTDALKNVICTPADHLEQLRDILDRYVLLVFGGIICDSVSLSVCYIRPISNRTVFSACFSVTVCVTLLLPQIGDCGSFFFAGQSRKFCLGFF